MLMSDIVLEISACWIFFYLKNRNYVNQCVQIIVADKLYKRLCIYIYYIYYIIYIYVCVCVYRYIDRHINKFKKYISLLGPTYFKIYFYSFFEPTTNIFFI